MIILIDAYNLLKTVLHTQFIQDAQRIQFLQLFEKYAQRRGKNEVVLVFDGGQDP
jgi:predicted RNA-binding protein with PIN domain